MPQRLIKELVALYRLEPTVRDVFVEGSTDRSIVAWFLQKQGRATVAVREIDSVEVPAEVLARYRLSGGNRSKVIALGKELCDTLGEATLQATAIIDSDFDRLLNADHQCSLILSTDYTCMEMYFLDREILSKYFRVTLQRDAFDADATLAQYRRTLREVFLVRAANDALGLRLSIIDFDKYLTRTGGELKLDRDKYITNVLTSSGAYRHRQALLEKIEELRNQLSEDVRQSANGHDFISMLWVDSRTLARRAGLSNAFAVASTLRGMADLEILQGEALFVRLLQRTAPQAT
jgi:hypothetical protein